MAVSLPNVTMKNAGEDHGLNVFPAAMSFVVLVRKEQLLQLIDLKTLVTDLGRVGALNHTAYNGIMALGPQYTELQIEIQQLGYGNAKLCETAAITVAKFKNATSTVLSHLQATYKYLLGNSEDMALQILSSISKIAEDMVEDAQKLHDEFEKHIGKVVTALYNTQKAISKHIEEKMKEQQELKEKLEYYQKLLEDAQRWEREAEAQRLQIEANEGEAIGSFSMFKKLINFMARMEVFDDESTSERKLKYWKEKRMEALEKVKECRQLHYEALERTACYAAKIKNCPLAENTTAVAAVGALRETVTVLKELSTVTMHTVHFWKQMQEHCRTLAEEEMKGMVEMAMKYSDEKRIKLWTTDGFKEQAIHFYAGWVALKDFCTEYFDQIKLTQKDLYRYLQENPTCEECRRNIHKLSSECDDKDKVKRID